MSDIKTKDTPALSPIELERRVSVAEAARIKGISEDSFRRHYGHVIERVSPRRQAVRLKHAVSKKKPEGRNRARRAVRP
jgi:hypothetical protein